MKSKKMDSDLLRKYAEGICSEEERIIVEEWLKSETFDDIPSNALFENNRNKWKQEIWESLPSEWNCPKQKQYCLPLLNIAKYAACIAIFISVAMIFLQRETPTNKLADVRSLAPQIVQVCDQPIFIVAEDNSEIVFVSKQTNSENLYHKVNCEKGNTYLAIMVKYKSTNEILVIDHRDIQSLPPLLGMQIANQITS